MSSARNTLALEVSAFGREVGTLAHSDDGMAFQYSPDWLASGFSLSPFSLPAERRVFTPQIRAFDGLFGVFADSLPDGWGRLLLDRLLRRLGEDPEKLSALDRLAIVGTNGMGALEYRPVWDMPAGSELRDYDLLAQECRKIFHDEYSADLDRLFHLGGSSGGARPKVLVDIDGTPWIVKFHTSREDSGAGRMEYEYARCAVACGINLPEVRLLPSNECDGYFAIKRFDRVPDGEGEVRKVHMISAAGLLETSHRVPNLDYVQLMRLTQVLTNDAAQLQELFRRMCFNVFAHNRDDHSKNFSFLHGEGGGWMLSPAYDLTYSNSIGGEHATTVAGEGARPGMADILNVAKTADLDLAWAEETARTIRRIVGEHLESYVR